MPDMNFLDQYESVTRISLFVGVLVVMAILEAVMPRKERAQSRPGRWFTNLTLVVVDTAALRLALPLLAIGVATYASERGWGLLSMVEWPFWVEVVLSVIILDMMIYWQHVAAHHLPPLWALHKVHHADRDIDVTTGLRFHPLEILFSMVYKMLCVLVLGPPALGVFIFEVLLNACAMFNHANFKIPVGVDKILRLFLVTPDMHRVHHSAIMRETNSNYGFSISLWDRIFGSYIDQPEKGHDGMTIGLEEYQTEKPANLLWCLVVPFASLFRSKKKASS